MSLSIAENDLILMKKLLATVLTGLTLAPSIAYAHPHVFAEAKMEVIEGADGTISEVRNLWRFDEMFSASVVLDFDENSDLKLDEKELAEIGTTVIDSLEEFSYYTYLTKDGQPIALARPRAIHVTYDNQQITMFFTAKPQDPLIIKGKLSFGSWDPTMYTAIDFGNDDDLAQKGDGLAKCQRTVIRPDVDEVLSQNQETLTEEFFADPNNNDMSKLFATRLELNCP
jgi:ABC-type uncharacterized transport system substrate-binding protein